MFKKIVTTSITLAALTLGSHALAANYVGGNISAMNYERDGVSDDADLVALYGRLGTEFSENFSGELRLGTGIDDDKIYGRKVKLNHMYGAYVRGGIPIAQTFYPYAIVGVTRAKTKFGSTSNTESDLSLGLGTDIRMGNGLDLNLECMNYLDKSRAQLDGFSIGLSKRF